MKNIIITLVAVFFIIEGCDRTPNYNTGIQNDEASTSGDSGDGHSDVSLLLTSYSGNWEIFAEAAPFVTGHESDILAHFTSLPDFSPLRKGRVTVSLITGEATVSQVMEEPLRTGIYGFTLTPTTAGDARMIFEIETGIGTDTVEVTGLHIYDEAHTALHSAQADMPQATGSVTFTKEQSWQIEFATGTVASQPFGPVLKTVGEVLPAQGDEVVMTARTNGIVRFTSRELYAGTTVEQGEPLLNIMGGSLAEGNSALRYREARNNYERATADYERISTLAADRIVSERELLQARNQFENAKATYESLQENFSEGGQTLNSPFSGYLSNLNVTSGQYVETGQPVATVSRNRELIIRTELQQRYSHLLGSIHSANFITGGGNSYTLEQLEGSVISTARSVSEGSHLLPVHLQISGNPDIIPGTLLDVFFRTRTGNHEVVVPSTSLIEEQGNYFVYVQIHPESFQKRQVFTGEHDGFNTSITSGLNEGERIVTRGAVMLKAATAAGAIDPHSGHVH
ncbi:MAG: efflux RND transporter periplasmic adaptor subunit [Bacteroidales bacterium]